MRFRSKKRAKIERKLEPFLDAYKAEFPGCQIPGCRRLGEDIHELIRGARRIKARAERSCILHLCRRCHDEIQDLPPVYHLAWKMLSNSGYDLPTYIRVRGKGPNAVEQFEVDLIVRRLKLNHGPSHLS